MNADFTWADIRQRQLQGDLLIVSDQKVYDLSKWAQHHPGGDLVLQHASKTDATDIIIANHPSWVIENRLPRFHIGNLVVDKPRTKCFGLSSPRVVTPKFRRKLSYFKSKDRFQVRHNIVEDLISYTISNQGESAPIPRSAEENFSYAYRQLETRIKREGFYDNDFVPYICYVVSAAIFLCASVWIASSRPFSDWTATVVSALLMSAFWHRLAFMGHDAGHNCITHNSNIDHKIGILIANLCGGISIGWWKKSHNVHHTVPNHPEHDPDIQHLPFFAVSNRFFDSLHSSYHNRQMIFTSASKVFVSMQHYLYYPVLCFGRFNLYAQSFLYLVTEKRVRYRKLEIFCLILFWIWYSTILFCLPGLKHAITFTAISHIFTAILHVQITLSHFGMSTDSVEGECFASETLRTTMDLNCSPAMDWFHGGLQFQVEHHLFPRISLHRLRSLRPLVEEMCKKHDVRHHAKGFIDSNMFVIDSLRSVAREAMMTTKRHD